MKLNSIKISNYRCYQDNDFDFGDDTTIIIGKNGTGKSSLLSAIRKGMTFVFSNTEKNKFITNNTNTIEGFSDWDTTYIENGEGFVWPTQIEYEISLKNLKLSWSFYKDKYNGKLHPNLYKKTQVEFEKYHFQGHKNLPILSFYGDCYPHKVNSKNAVVNKFNENIITKKVLPRDAGYFLWNIEGSIVASWFNRTKFIMNEIQHNSDTLQNIEDDIKLLKERILNDGQNNHSFYSEQLNILQNRLHSISNEHLVDIDRYKDELKFIQSILFAFFSQFNEFDHDELFLVDIKKRKVEKSEKLFFNFSKKDSFNEGVYTEDSLPMGYKRLIHIIYDIAYRWYIMNGSNKDFEGIVLIDELELHLHPSLQQTVLERFRKTFPGLQFIITTHSPIILSNFYVDKKSTKIILLNKVNGEYKDKELNNLYSIDYNSNLIDIMGVNVSDKLLDSYVNAYQFLKDDDPNLANEYYLKIQELYSGNIPQFLLNKLK